VAQTAIAADLLQPIDILSDTSPKLPFRRHAAFDRAKEATQLVFGKVARSNRLFDSNFLEDLPGPVPPDSEYVRQGD
jgi:hypothetical protein